MPNTVTRRAFLAQSAGVLAGVSLQPPDAARGTGLQAGGWNTLVTELEDRLPRLLTQFSVPGISMAIIKDGEIAWRRGVGVKDASTRAPVETNTVFEAASMSKPVFAYAVMKLCERGVLSLDTPLVEYSPAPFLEGDARVSRITARHVLAHTTGFQNWRSDEHPLAIQFPPGSRYGYSGEGFCYLQRVIAHLTRQPFEAFMQAQVLRPLGMTSSGYVWSDLFATHAARPHDDGGRPLDNRKRTPADVARYGAAGDLHSTPSDYASFLIEVIKPRPPDAWRLTSASLAEMRRPHIRASEWHSRGLGWELVTAQPDIIQHGGDNPGFRAFAAASVGSRYGMVAMTNGNNGAALLGAFFGSTLKRIAAA